MIKFVPVALPRASIVATVRVTEVNELYSCLKATTKKTIVRQTCLLPVIIGVRIDISLHPIIFEISQLYVKAPLFCGAKWIDIDRLVVVRRREVSILVSDLLYIGNRGEIAFILIANSDNLKVKLQCEVWNSVTYKRDVVFIIECQRNVDESARVQLAHIKAVILVDCYDLARLKCWILVERNFCLACDDLGTIMHQLSTTTGWTVRSS